MLRYKTILECAIDYGNDPVKIRRRLIDARSLLMPTIKKDFKMIRFDLQNQRMLSDDGKLVLQWKLRRNPSEPESTENQQTSVGIVLLETIQ